MFVAKVVAGGWCIGHSSGRDVYGMTTTKQWFGNTTN